MHFVSLYSSKYLTFFIINWILFSVDDLKVVYIDILLKTSQTWNFSLRYWMYYLVLVTYLLF